MYFKTIVAVYEGSESKDSPGTSDKTDKWEIFKFSYSSSDSDSDSKQFIVGDESNYYPQMSNKITNKFLYLESAYSYESVIQDNSVMKAMVLEQIVRNFYNISDYYWNT